VEPDWSPSYNREKKERAPICSLSIILLSNMGIFLASKAGTGTLTPR